MLYAHCIPTAIRQAFSLCLGHQHGLQNAAGVCPSECLKCSTRIWYTILQIVFVYGVSIVYATQQAFLSCLRCDTSTVYTTRQNFFLCLYGTMRALYDMYSTAYLVPGTWYVLSLAYRGTVRPLYDAYNTAAFFPVYRIVSIIYTTQQTFFLCLWCEKCILGTRYGRSFSASVYDGTVIEYSGVYDTTGFFPSCLCYEHFT